MYLPALVQEKIIEVPWLWEGWEAGTFNYDVCWIYDQSVFTTNP
jgi:hypothetical protein